MSIAYFARKIQPGEKIKHVIYPSVRRFFGRIILSCLLIWGSLYGYYPLVEQWGIFAQLAVILVLLRSVWVLIKTFVRLRYTAWVITKQRLLDFSVGPLLKVRCEEVQIDDLAEPTIQQSWWGAVLNYATVMVLLPAESAYIELVGVVPYRDLEEVLFDVVAAQPQPNKEVQKTKAALRKLEQELGQEEFEKLLLEYKRSTTTKDFD